MVCRLPHHLINKLGLRATTLAAQIPYLQWDREGIHVGVHCNNIFPGTPEISLYQPVLPVEDRQR